MPPSVASVSTVGWGNHASNFVVTKPTGLAENDLLVAIVGSVTADYAPPAGWSQRDIKTNASLVRIEVFDKVASAADAAASNFTFTGTSWASCVLMRITGAAYIASPYNGSSTGESNVEATMTLAAAFTPTVNNCLLVAGFVATGGTDTQPLTMSGYVINGTNPTWTEQADINADTGSNRHGLAVATASQTTAAQISTVYVDTENAGDAANRVAVVLAYTPIINATGTTTLVTSSPTLFNVSPEAGVTANFSAPVTSTPTLPTQSGRGTRPPSWTNPDKPAAPTWTNPDKP